MARSPKPWWRNDRQSWFVTIDGTRHNLGPDEKEAQRLFHELMAKPPDQRTIRSDSLLAVFDFFLDWTQRNRAPLTYKWYVHRLEWFGKSLPRDMAAHELKPFHVQQWIDSKNCSDGHKRGCVTAIIRAMNWAFRMGYIERNPLVGFEKPRAGRRETVITAGEFKKILKLASDLPFKKLLLVAWETGCRPQEILRVETRHVDLGNSRWVFPEQESKGRTRMRAVYLPARSKAITQRLAALHPVGCLFRNRDGEPWTRNSVNCRFIRMQEKLGKKFCLYDFRHSFATRMLQAGVDALVVGALMGHADLSMLGRTYAHLSQDPQHLLEQLARAGG